MKIIVNAFRKEYCLYDENMADFDRIIFRLKEKYGNKNINYYETTSDMFNEDCEIEELRGSKRVNVGDWM